MRTPSKTLKIAVVAPIPMASVAIAMALMAGLRRNARKAQRKSRPTLIESLQAASYLKYVAQGQVFQLEVNTENYERTQKDKNRDQRSRHRMKKDRTVKE